MYLLPYHGRLEEQVGTWTAELGTTNRYISTYLIYTQKFKGKGHDFKAWGTGLSDRIETMIHLRLEERKTEREREKTPNWI